MENNMKRLQSYEIHRVISVVPGYDQDGGNETTVTYDDGKRVHINKKLKYVMQWMKRQSLYNVDLLMKENQVCFARKQILPIPLSPDCILLPLKCRRPFGENDGAYAYIALDWVERVETNSVILKNDYGSLHVIGQTSKVMQQLAIARTIRSEYFTDIYKQHQDRKSTSGVQEVREVVVSFR